MQLFEEVAPGVRHARAGTAIGVVTRGERALLVDSGLDENLARKVVNALAAEGVQVAAVVNTHAHADHIGGNAWITRRTGARLAAPAYEHHFVEHPELEPYTLYGALPPRALQGKFLQAPASRVDHVLTPGEHDVEGFRIRLHALPGHSVGQLGVEVETEPGAWARGDTPGVLFVGDALLPEATLAKYGVPFAVDPTAARASALALLEQDATLVSYHGGMIDDPRRAVEANVEAMTAAENVVLSALARGPTTAEDVLAELLDLFPPAQLTVELHALQTATVRGYLASLERAGRAEALLDRRRLVWRLRAG